MKYQFSNYFKVRRRIPQAGNNAYAIKWSNSAYAVLFHGENQDINPNSTPVLDNIGECNGLFGQDTYNLVKNKTIKVNEDYYSETDAAFNTMQTEATLSVIQNSLVVYSMLCTMWRTQSGYLKTDVEGRFLSPVLFNHSFKNTNNVDWQEGGGVNFATVRPQNIYADQRAIQNSGDVAFSFGVANEAWANLIGRVVNSIKLPDRMKELAEHLFTTVFLDPDAKYNPSFLTFFPASGYNIYTPQFDANQNLINLDVREAYLNGYDVYDDRNGFRDADNNSTWNDVVDYFEAFMTYVDNMLDLFPQMNRVLDELGIKSGSTFNFTRSLTHDQLLIIDNEDISDLVQSTAFAPFLRTTAGDYNEPLDEMFDAAPVFVRDKAYIHAGADVDYQDKMDIETERSYELFLQGKVTPLRFAYLEYQGSTAIAGYVFMYLVPREFANSLPAAQIANVTVLNTVLADADAIVPVYNIIQTAQDDATYGDTASPRPTIHSFYKNVTNIALAVEKAQDSFFK